MNGLVLVMIAQGMLAIVASHRPANVTESVDLTAGLGDKFGAPLPDQPKPAPHSWLAGLSERITDTAGTSREITILTDDGRMPSSLIQAPSEHP